MAQGIEDRLRSGLDQDKRLLSNVNGGCFGGSRGGEREKSEMIIEPWDVKWLNQGHPVGPEWNGELQRRWI